MCVCVRAEGQMGLPVCSKQSAVVSTMLRLMKFGCSWLLMYLIPSFTATIYDPLEFYFSKLPRVVNLWLERWGIK